MLGPLKITDQVSRLDVFVNAKGGGITGQAGAVSQGLARALKTMFSPQDEQRERVFGTTTIIKTLRDEKREQARAKAIPARPAAPAPAAPAADANATPLIPGGTPAAPAAPGRRRRRHDQEAPRLRLPDPRRPHEGAQEVRPRGARRGTQFSKR